MSMQTAADILAEFPPISKAEWLARVAKDLKDRLPAELEWRLSNDITVTPFVHADDFPQPPQPLIPEAKGWEINEDLGAGNPEAANKQALEALAGGVESLTFFLAEPPKTETLSALLAGIHLDFISVHFAGPGLDANPGAVLAGLENIARSQHLQPAALRGSLGYHPAAALGRLHDWRYLTDLAAFVGDNWPGFRTISVSTESLGNPESAVDELADLIRQGNLYLEKLTERGLSVEKAAAQIQFSVQVGTTYFVEIAKLRALKILWLNVLTAWKAGAALPLIEVRFAAGSYQEADPYSNLIRATTMSLSAVLGGTNRLTVLPYDTPISYFQFPISTTPRGLRFARNIQHLLKMESFLDQAADPAAGSYYIETLTRQLAQAAWHTFQQSHGHAAR